MPRIGILGVTLLSGVFFSSAWAQPTRMAVDPITDLGRRADLIVLATIEQVTDNAGAPCTTLQLRVIRALQGDPGGLTAFAQFVAPADHARYYNSGWARAVAGKTGIWFLKSGGANYEILPVENADYSEGRDFFLAMADSPTLAAVSGTLNQRLLAYLVAWYQAVPNPTLRDDDVLLASLEQRGPESPSRQDVLAAVAPLIESSSPAQHALGLVAALRMGLPDAVSTVVNELPNLQSGPRFQRIVQAILAYPQNPSCIPALQQLAALHTDIPDLDASVASALAKFRTKAALPAMVELLDSKDPEAQRRASWFFGLFTMFADASGNMRDSGSPGPFSTEETRRNMPPGVAVSPTPAEYAQFWKAWWAANKSKLGF